MAQHGLLPETIESRNEIVTSVIRTTETLRRLCRPVTMSGSSQPSISPLMVMVTEQLVLRK
jgi:hypothetical protein